MRGQLHVGVALLVNDIRKLDEKEGHFEATIDLRLRWQDLGQAFDAQVVGVDRQELSGEAAADRLATIWTPRVELANVPEAPLESDPGLFISADGTVVYVQRIRAVFDSKLNLRAFPFDSQALVLQIRAPRETTGQIALVQEQQDLDASGLRPGAELPDWTLETVNSRPPPFAAGTAPATPKWTLSSTSAAPRAPWRRSSSSPTCWCCWYPPF